MNKRYYIAYGSNLNIGQMRHRCPAAKIVGTSVIEDYRLLFKGSKTGSYLTIEPFRGGKVPVAVWSVEPADERRLDIYEGYPDFYYKTEMQLNITGIRTGKNRVRPAFVYIMHEERKLGIPSMMYWQVCCEGYERFHFDIQHLIDAYKASTQEE